MTPALAQAHGVTVVPLQVLLGDVTYKDGVDLTASEFYAGMARSPAPPRTSQPTPHDFMVAYQAAAARGPVLGVHVSSALSGTWQTAMMVARDLGDQVRVFDSRNGSGGQALMVLEAARMAAAGADIDAILARLEVLRAQVRTLVALNTLEYAVKGGRVSPLAGMASNLLNLKPIVHVTREGKVEAIDKVRGRGRALDRLLDLAADEAGTWQDRVAVVAHGGARADGEAFADRVRERFHPRDVLLLEIGPTIGSYAAQGAILLSF